MKKLLFGIFAVLAMTSCKMSAGDVYVTGISDPKPVGITLAQARFVVYMDVTNESKRNITITKGVLTVLDQQGNEIADIVLAEEFTIRKRSENYIPVQLTIKPKNPLGMLGVVFMKNPESLRQARVNYRITGKRGSIKRSFSDTNIPAREFIRSLGIADF